jgi:hypothetical protein
MSNVSNLASEDDETDVQKFTSFASPFGVALRETLRVPVSNQNPTFGFELHTDKLNNHVFVQNIIPSSPASRLRSTPKAINNAIRGAYLVAVNDVLVFNKKQAVTVLQRLFDS